MQPNIAHAQVVVAKRKGVFQDLVEAHGDALGLVLTREAKQVLHDAVGALGLFVKLFAVLQALGTDLAASRQKLAVSGLLSSCATPEISWPTAAIFSL